MAFIVIAGAINFLVAAMSLWLAAFMIVAELMYLHRGFRKIRDALKPKIDARK